MTLEAAIAENTAAVRELIAQLRSGTALQQPTAEAIDANIKALNAAQAQEAAAPKPTPAAKPAKPVPTPSTAEAPVPAQSPRGAEPADPPAAEALDYATTAKAVNALVKASGRQAAVDVLASFGAATLKDVQPAQYAAVVAACNAKA